MNTPKHHLGPSVLYRIKMKLTASGKNITVGDSWCSSKLPISRNIGTMGAPGPGCTNDDDDAPCSWNKPSPI
jgi:hypothetical protein